VITEEFLRLTDIGRHQELLDGRHYVHPTPPLQHQFLAGRILVKLAPSVTDDTGILLLGRLDVVLSPRDVVQPDLMFISAARRLIINDINIEGAPDLVIEIIAPFTRELDTRLKFKTCERHGIAEYWIVDPDASSVAVFRRSGNAFVGAGSSDVLTTPLLPGFALPVAALFA
jgi:Uma2 family endonuclease